MKNISQTDNYFVMSTGRTGTTFLYQFLRNSYSELGCFQEPPPNWLFNLYSNLYSTKSVGPTIDSLIRSHFLSSRNKLINSMKGLKYIEVNPFIFGLGNPLKKWLGEIKIVHIVRHPLTYIPSVLNYIPSVLYRFPSKYRSHLRERFLWNLNVSRALKDKNIEWESLSKIEQKAWYWVYVNHRIQSYEETSERYLVIKFENLFSPEKAIQEKAIKSLINFLGLELPKNIYSNEFANKVNESLKDPTPPWNQWDKRTLESVLRICGKGMEKYDYRALPVETSPLELIP